MDFTKALKGLSMRRLAFNGIFLSAASLTLRSFVLPQMHRRKGVSKISQLLGNIETEIRKRTQPKPKICEKHIDRVNGVN